jgi:ribosomal protein S18 acetylase RimI-like enzyme
MNLVYRNSTQNDLEKIKALGLLSYGQHSSVLGEGWQLMQTNLSNDRTWENLLNTSTGFLCESEGRLIGMAFLVPNGNPNDIYPADVSYIRMVGVHPDFSGRGIAKELTFMCIQHARKINEGTVMLHTSEFMDAARHIYEQMGFKIVKEIPPRFGKKYWLYSLPLK